MSTKKQRTRTSIDFTDEQRQVLDELGLDTTQRLVVYNKLDLLAPTERAPLERVPGAVTVCAQRRDTLHVLLRRIEALLARSRERGPATRSAEGAWN